ncbi:cytochrome oxidase [Castellaniella caeni]|uniref:cytochrome oxidase n=1 Tax=Castellaniella caeni TaxID=266123 RepID=UPI0008317756|nr:cytochrome oxidase [Castellaniella caeni]
MTVQNVVWPLALLGIAAVALIFIFVISQAGKPASVEETRQAAHTAHVIQARFFAVLVVGFAVGTWLTLRHFPIPQQHQPLHADQAIDVEGFMWGWNIQPTTVRAGQTVEFRVTSKDVNHDFAIYGPDGNVVAQTQAMPGFTNKLLYTFQQAGVYTVQCLEYCGVGHGVMRTTITVAAAGD